MIGTLIGTNIGTNIGTSIGTSISIGILIVIILGVLFFNKSKEGLSVAMRATDKTLTASKNDPPPPNITPEQTTKLISNINKSVESAGMAPPSYAENVFAQLATLANQVIEQAGAKTAAVEQSDATTPVMDTVTPTCLGQSFFKGTKMSDAFCDLNKGNPTKLNIQCAALTADGCNQTDCCVWANGTKCVAGDAKGSTFISDMIYYSHKYKWYGYGECGI